MRHDGRRQAENPLIPLSSFARPPLLVPISDQRKNIPCAMPIASLVDRMRVQRANPYWKTEKSLNQIFEKAR
jgi:hypothetical protein